MNSEKSLQPQSRPDRKGLWVRLRHPISGAILRVDLGRDRQEAEIVCDDLNAILGAPQSWEDRNHPDLDGLHERALNAFFAEIKRFESHLRATIAERQFQILKLRISTVDMMVKMIWMTSEAGKKAGMKGDFDFADMLDNLDGNDDEIVQSPKRNARRRRTRQERVVPSSKGISEGI